MAGSLALKPAFATIAAAALAICGACADGAGAASVETVAATSPVTAQIDVVPSDKADQAPGWVIAVHGGAGVISKSEMTAEKEATYRESLQAALDAGAGVLADGGSSLDAVVAATIVLEDAPVFNAGKGSVLTRERAHELDASIMDGRDKNAGAVAGVAKVRNPILAARAVMEESEHVMFAGAAADAFAEAHGLEPVENSYFTTEFRAEALEEALQQEAESRDKRGTVGAVALDLEGHLAAATSTGGMTAKAPGRVGDSPIIGAGTYADDKACAVSGTGHGEYFIRTAVARTICARMALQGLDGGAAATILLDEVQALGGDGGVIVIDPKGDVSMVFNTEGMFRGVASSDGVIETAIYGLDD